MKYSMAELISDIELNDFKVKNIFLDIKNSIFQIDVEGCYLIKNSQIKELVNGGVIRIDSFQSFEARYFDPKTKLMHTLDYQNLEMIDEICEKFYENGRLMLSGHGKSGYWLDYIISQGSVLISFES